MAHSRKKASPRKSKMFFWLNLDSCNVGMGRLKMIKVGKAGDARQEPMTAMQRSWS